MQQQLIDLAVAAGAELLRPAEVTGVIPGDPSTITLRADGAEQRVTAHLVVGADGRNSRVRGWAGFPVGRDPDGIAIAGILYRDLALPEDAVQFALNPDVQRLSIIFPIGDRRFRAYVAFRHGAQAPSAAPRITTSLSNCRLQPVRQRSGSEAPPRSGRSHRLTRRTAGLSTPTARVPC